MFIFERVFAVFIYAIILAIILLLIEQKKSNYKLILICYTIILSIMGFFYVPYKTADLYRIYENLNRYSHYNWNQFYNGILSKNILKIDLIYYWLIAQTGEVRLLPAINAFLCYSCVFYIIVRTAKLCNIHRSNIALAVFFFMSIGGYIFVISGIRSMLGICLLCFCFFRESVEKKFKLWHIPLYIISAFIHNFTFVLIFIRLCVPLITKNISLSKKVVYFFVLGISALLVLSFYPGYIREVFNKAEGYTTNEVYSYEWDYAIGILVGGIILMALYNMTKIDRGINNSLKEIKIFTGICLFIAIVFSFEFTIFHRTITYIAPLLALPIIMTTAQGEKIIVYRWGLFVLIGILLFIVCARGSLCSLKFFQR